MNHNPRSRAHATSVETDPRTTCAPQPSPELRAAMVALLTIMAAEIVDNEEESNDPLCGN